MKQILTSLILFISLLGNTQNNPADVDLTIGNDYASFTSVNKIVTQPDGKILVGGAYYNTNGRVARFNTDGSTDTSFQINSFTHNTSNVIISDIIIQSDGKILVSGLFSSFNGEFANYIIRLNSDGTKDTSFAPSQFTSGGGILYDMALQPDGKIIIGGQFSVQVNGHNQYNACRLNTDGSIDHSFDFGPEGGPPNGTGGVRTIALQSDGKVLLGGSFAVFNNQSQGTLIRLHPDGSKDTTFDIGSGGNIGFVVGRILLQPDNKILIAGGFETWDGQPKAHLIRLNSNGSIDDSFINEFSVSNVGNNTPTTMNLLANGKILVVGNSFTLYGQKNLWLLNSDGTLDNSLSIDEDSISQLNTIVELSNGKILLGGMFTEFEGRMRDCYVRLNQDGSLDTSFLSQGFNDEVVTMALQEDGKVILGGSFTTFNTISQNRIIRINGDDGTKDMSFNIGSGFNGDVKIILIQSNGKILIGGDFTMYNGQNANHLIRLNHDGTIDTTFNIGLGFNAYVKTIALQPDGKIVIGGNFTTYNGQSQNYLVRLNENGTKDSTFNIENSFNDRVTSLILQEDAKIIVGGNFTTFNGDEQRYLVRLHETGTKDVSFTPPQNDEFLWSYTSEDAILDFALTLDKIYVVTGHIPRRLNMDGSLDDSFIALYYNTKSIAIQNNNEVLLGGTFSFIFNNGGYRRGLVQLNNDGTVDTDFDISLNGSMALGGFFQNNINDIYGCKDILIQPDNKIWLGGNFFSYRGYESFGVVRLIGNDENLSIDDFENANTEQMAIFPNPVNNTLKINTKNKESIHLVEIYNLTGQLVLKQTSGGDTIDVSTLDKSIYLIKITTSNTREYTSKFIKQ